MKKIGSVMDLINFYSKSYNAVLEYLENSAMFLVVLVYGTFITADINAG